MARIHIVLDETEKARYRVQAEREGKSLGAWLREAAEDRLAAADAGARLDSVERLRTFFRDCDARETAPEPDWSEHRGVMDRSRSAGLDVT